MGHMSEGQLRAFIDDALPPREGETVRSHLETCPRCSRLLARVEARTAWVSTSLAQLDPEVSSRIISPQAARRRLDAYETYAEDEEEAKTPMSILKRVFSRRYSPAWVAVMVVLVLGLSLTLPPVRAFAGDVLALFRVEKIEVVAFDPTSLADEQGFESAMRSLEQVMDEQVTVEAKGEPREVDEGGLRALSSIPVRLPQDVEGEPTYTVQPGADISVQVDLPRIRALMAELGFDDVTLPDSLDGAEVNVQLSPAVIAAYGACEQNPESWSAAHGPSDFDGDCTVLMQMMSPDVSAPDDLDVRQLGQAYLQLLGMGPDEAARFSEQIDWTATLVVPVPRSEAAYSDVQVDGVEGALIRPTSRRRPQSEYLLMWVKTGVVYALMGEGDTQEALSIANSLR